jgi:hypothetical protein
VADFTVAADFTVVADLTVVADFTVAAEDMAAGIDRFLLSHPYQLQGCPSDSVQVGVSICAPHLSENACNLRPGSTTPPDNISPLFGFLYTEAKWQR